MAVIERHVPSASELKWFGLLGALFLGGAGGLAWWRGHAMSALALGSLAAVFVVLYYALRPLRRPLFDLWMALAFPFGLIISYLMLGCVFYLVITPIGSIVRLLGKDPMRRRFDRSAASYWMARDPRAPAARYFQQF